jgi:hypothetical protein
MIAALEAAQHYRSLGWSAVPLWWPTVTGCACLRRGACLTPGKHPCISTWRHLQVERASADDLTAWWHRWPLANVGVITGLVSGLAVVDIDPRSGGDETLHELDALGLWMPEDSGAVETGGKGLHHWLALTDPLPKAAPWQGIEVQADGGLVVAPPSLHASGRRYRWLRPGSSPLPPLPRWVALSVEAPRAPSAVSPLAPGSLTGDDLTAAFRESCRYLRPHRHPGWHRVRCLWAEEHSNADPEALLMEPGSTPAPGFSYRCLHAHCAERGIGAVLDFFGVPRRRS